MKIPATATFDEAVRLIQTNSSFQLYFDSGLLKRNSSQISQTIATNWSEFLSMYMVGG